MAGVVGVIRRTPTSRKDYRAIWDSVAEHGSQDAADALLRMFDGQVQFLSDSPSVGPARPELRPRLQSYPVGNRILFTVEPAAPLNWCAWSTEHGT